MPNPLTDPFGEDAPLPEIEPVVPAPDAARNGWTTETLTKYVAERLRAEAQIREAARRPGPTKVESDYDIQGF